MDALSLYFEPSLGALSLRFDVISSIVSEQEREAMRGKMESINTLLQTVDPSFRALSGRLESSF